jgi:hypothetical protein
MRDVNYGSSDDGEVEARVVLRVPGEPDKPVVVKMPKWAVPRKGGGK